MKTVPNRHPSNRKDALKLAFLTALLLPTAALANGAVTVTGDAAGARTHATLSGRMDAARPITIAIVLPLTDEKGAVSFATRVSQPGDPLFRQYLTPVQYAARFGARQADYDAVVAWAKANGLTPGEVYASRAVLPITGSAAAMEAALGVKFYNYKDAKGATYFAADRNASLPVEIAAKVNAVIGLSSANHFQPYVIIKPVSKGHTSNSQASAGGYTAKVLRTAYGVVPQALPNQTQTLAVFEQGGFFASDVAKYVVASKLPAIPVIARGVNGYGTSVDDPSVELEAVLDIDMQMAMNPAARRIIVYEDGTDSFPVALLDSFSAMATDNQAKTISVSYGMDEDYTYAADVAAENDALVQLTAQGQAVFVSTGDLGAYGDAPPNLHTSDPSTQPFVTAVGGTTLFVNSRGGYLAEEVWNDLPTFGATGGGISTYWPIPSYQAGLYGTTQNGGSGTMRNTPDVAAVASPLTAVSVYSALNGGWVTVGGTSVSAPIWAGMYSLGSAASEALGFGTPGFANPILYRISVGYGLYAQGLLDLYDGSNGDANVYGAPGYNSGFGYDNCSGLGSIQAAASLAANIGVVPALFHGGTPPGPPGHMLAVPTSTSVTLSWSAASGAGGYIVQGAKVQGILTTSLPNYVSHKAPFVETGLRPNNYYTFTVVAVGPNGTTESAPVYIKTLK
jgi:subtilase family serine protease